VRHRGLLARRVSAAWPPGCKVLCNLSSPDRMGDAEEIPTKYGSTFLFLLVRLRSLTETRVAKKSVSVRILDGGAAQFTQGGQASSARPLLQSPLGPPLCHGSTLYVGSI